MYVTDTKCCLFVSWTFKKTAVFLVKYDQEYVDMILKIIAFVYNKHIFGKRLVTSGNPYNEILEIYKPFLQRTKEIVKKSERIYLISNE
jgi:hypothetical protein